MTHNLIFTIVRNAKDVTIQKIRDFLKALRSNNDTVQEVTKKFSDSKRRESLQMVGLASVDQKVKLP